MHPFDAKHCTLWIDIETKTKLRLLNITKDRCTCGYAYHTHADERVTFCFGFLKWHTRWKQVPHAFPMLMVRTRSTDVRMWIRDASLWKGLKEHRSLVVFPLVAIFEEYIERISIIGKIGRLCNYLRVIIWSTKK